MFFHGFTFNPTPPLSLDAPPPMLVPVMLFSVPQCKHMVFAVTCVYSHVLPLCFSQDHINFIIGRQSFNLRQLEDALSAFKELLLGESLQSSEQQASYLREFLFVFQV